MSTHRTTVYMILQPVRRGYDGTVTGIDVDRILKSKPGKLGVRDIAVQLDIEVDDRLFTVPQPKVTIRLDDERAIIVPSIDVVPQPEPQEGEAEEQETDGD